MGAVCVGWRWWCCCWCCFGIVVGVDFVVAVVMFGLGRLLLAGTTRTLFRILLWAGAWGCGSVPLSFFYDTDGG